MFIISIQLMGKSQFLLGFCQAWCCRLHWLFNFYLCSSRSCFYIFATVSKGAIKALSSHFLLIIVAWNIFPKIQLPGTRTQIILRFLFYILPTWPPLKRQPFSTTTCAETIYLHKPTKTSLQYCVLISKAEHFSIV